MDVAWEAGLFNKAKERQLALLYQHSHKALKELLTEEIRRAESLQ
jgi:hypothetical protein